MRPFNSSNAAILLANLPNREENIDWPVGFYVATRQTITHEMSSNRSIWSVSVQRM